MRPPNCVRPFHEPSRLRVADPRSGARLCEAQRFMVPMRAQKRKEAALQLCVRSAAILVAGSAGILVRRTLGRQGCRPNWQAGSPPYVPEIDVPNVIKD